MCVSSLGRVVGFPSKNVVTIEDFQHNRHRGRLLAVSGAEIHLDDIVLTHSGYVTDILDDTAASEVRSIYATYFQSGENPLNDSTPLSRLPNDLSKKETDS